MDTTIQIGIFSLTALGWMVIIFTIIGSWGLWDQIKSIWLIKPRSAKSISGEWSITFLAMFTSFLLYGIHTDDTPMMFQGWARIAFNIPVVIGFIVYGEMKRRHVLLLILYSSILAPALAGYAVMSNETIFLIFAGLGILSSYSQTATIWIKKDRGRVSIKLQAVYLLSVIFWYFYAVMIKDFLLTCIMLGFCSSYSSTILMWLKNPKHK